MEVTGWGVTASGTKYWVIRTSESAVEPRWFQQALKVADWTLQRAAFRFSCFNPPAPRYSSRLFLEYITLEVQVKDGLLSCGCGIWGKPLVVVPSLFMPIRRRNSWGTYFGSTLAGYYLTPEVVEQI